MQNMDIDVESQMMEVDGEENILKKIVSQVSYYFGDINISRDKFMKTFTEVGEGWMPLTTLMTFKRLASLTNDLSLVKFALEQAPMKLVEINEAGTHIRRSPRFPLRQPWETADKVDVVPRTIFVKGFSEDVTLDVLIEFYRKYKTDRIKMRRYKRADNGRVVFKGSIFVTFKTIEEAHDYLVERSYFRDVELQKMKQSEYVIQRQEKREFYRLAKMRDISLKRAKRQPLPLGTLLFLHNIPLDITVERIKDAVKLHGGHSVYVNLMIGVAWVRLRDENTATKVYFSCRGLLRIEQANIRVVVITGLLELRYLNKIEEEIANARRLKEQRREQRRRGLSRRARRQLKQTMETAASTEITATQTAATATAATPAAATATAVTPAAATATAVTTRASATATSIQINDD